MSVSYDIFISNFLAKISEFEFIKLQEENRTAIVEGYMKSAIANFQNYCPYDFSTSGDDQNKVYNIDILDSELFEIADIISQGMVVQWLRPFVNRQELLELHLNTRDFSTFSSSELIKQIVGLCNKAQRDYIQMVREYSYNHGDLTVLHL